MPRPRDRGEYDVRIRFGGGVHSRASESDIRPNECAEGVNFLLDADNLEFKNRRPFDLISTAPNGASIDGGAVLHDSNGNVSVLIQAGTTVYEWEGGDQWTSKGTVNAGAKIRGPLSHNFLLDNKVIITDLALAEPVLEWNGTTLANTTFLQSDGSTSFGDFYAKYCFVEKERAFFANVKAITAVPHMIVGSQRENFEIISNSDRPSSSLSEADPFYMLAPDFRPINALVNAFGSIVTSTEMGSLYIVTGSSAKDFAIDEFYSRSGASGSESAVHIGNDILYGRAGRIESVTDTDRFGDTETDDLTLPVADQVEDYLEWTAVYNQRVQRVYFFPTDASGALSECWVLFKPLMGSQVSPWAKWTTTNGFAFMPSFAMSMLDPVDKLEYVFMGDSSGNLYRMEGTGTGGDAGADDIVAERLSALYEIPEPGDAFFIEGHISYRAQNAATVKLPFEYSGLSVFNEEITITLPGITSRDVFSGEVYFSNGSYFGTAFEGKLTRQQFGVAGNSNAFQVRAIIEGKRDIQIQEIALRFDAN